jgi:hypothetical protein
MKRCITARLRRLSIKDKHAAILSAITRTVNSVSNYYNELLIEVLERERHFIGAVEVQHYL